MCRERREREKEREGEGKRWEGKEKEGEGGKMERGKQALEKMLGLRKFIQKKIMLSFPYLLPVTAT